VNKIAKSIKTIRANKRKPASEQNTAGKGRGRLRRGGCVAATGWPKELSAGGFWTATTRVGRGSFRPAVKRPLTQVHYSLERRSVPPWSAGTRYLAPPRILRVVFDTPPSPSTVLLSAKEAKDRLREIVEGFFLRRLKTEDGKRIRRLLVKSPPGLGKTREAVHWAIRYQAEQEGKDGTGLLVDDFNEAGVPAQTSIFVPRHQLAEELREIIERVFQERGDVIKVPILRGRENGGEEGKAPCRRWCEARALARKGLPIYTNLCRRRSEGQWSQCPCFTGCEYIQTRQAAYASPFVILVHSHLGLEWGATAAERYYPLEDEDIGEKRQRHFNPR
jgi:hypothetical protein